MSKTAYTYNRKLAAWLGDTIVTVPDQIGSTEALHQALEAQSVDYREWPNDAQRHHDTEGTVFPAILPSGQKIKVSLDGEAYGLHTPGTGDMRVRRA